MTDDNGQPPPAEPAPAEPTSLLGSPVPPELAQDDPGLLVDSIRESGGPQRDTSARHTTHD